MMQSKQADDAEQASSTLTRPRRPSRARANWLDSALCCSRRPAGLTTSPAMMTRKRSAPVARSVQSLSITPRRLSTCVACCTSCITALTQIMPERGSIATTRHTTSTMTGRRVPLARCKARSPQVSEGAGRQGSRRAGAQRHRPGSSQHHDDRAHLEPLFEKNTIAFAKAMWEPVDHTVDFHAMFQTPDSLNDEAKQLMGRRHHYVIAVWAGAADATFRYRTLPERDPDNDPRREPGDSIYAFWKTLPKTSTPFPATPARVSSSAGSVRRRTSPQSSTSFLSCEFDPDD
ncbi:hypothetical protein BKA80DRAFT_120910 [Phyllosticta citrichinensis]